MPPKRTASRANFLKPILIRWLRNSPPNVRGSRQTTNALVNVPVWDEHAFDELRALRDQNLLKKVIHWSFDDADARIRELRDWRRAGSEDLWRESAHGLHCVALNLGALRLSRAVTIALDCGDFELAAEYEQEFVEQLAAVRAVLAEVLE